MALVRLVIFIITVEAPVCRGPEKGMSCIIIIGRRKSMLYADGVLGSPNMFRRKFPDGDFL